MSGSTPPGSIFKSRDKESNLANLNEGDDAVASAIAIPPVLVKSSLMPRNQLREVIELSKKLYEVVSKSDGTLWRDAAKLMKHELDRNEKPGAGSWHVVCGNKTAFSASWIDQIATGTSFGAYVSYEVDQMAYINIGHVDVLAFKHA